ncbi:MAG: NUDIX domain-containing protein [Methylobacteriaceae bacterium]|nr:NUDIX domain-containing protein [Methylobacteriaceae bacterium]
MRSDMREGWSPVTRLRDRLFHLLFLASRPMTLGVRAAALDGEGRVFLVRHTYVPGWYLPGGGVERGETMGEALRRELAEEGNIEMTAPPELFGVYFNNRSSPRDHVALYVVRAFRQHAPRLPDRELAETGFFPLDALPEAATAATRARLAEIAGQAARSDYW